MTVRQRKIYTDAQLAQWRLNPSAAPDSMRAFLSNAGSSASRREIVHPIPGNWTEVRNDIKEIYIALANLFPDADKVFMTGSRTTGRWRDADDPRCACNGGPITKRCPSDWDLDIEGIDLAEIRRRLNAWNESHGPELYADHPCYKHFRIEIPAELWKV